jgi:hypothetical protein
MPNIDINCLYVLSENGKEMIILKRLDLAEHDIVPPVVELHWVVVAHGIIAAEVDTLLKNTCYQRRLRMSSFTFVINYRIN